MKRYFTKIVVPISVQLLFTALYSITVALFPVLNKYLFDNILIEGTSLIPILVSAYLLLILSNSLFQYISRLYEWIVTKEFNIAIKLDLFLHIISLKSSRFKQRKTSDYLSIFNNNVEAIAEDYISAHIDLIKSILNILIFAAALLFFVNWKITAVVLFTSALAATVPKIMQSKLSKSRKNQLMSLRAYFNKVLDLLSGKKRINSFTVDAFVNEHSDSLLHSEKRRLVFGKIKTQSDMLNAIGVFLIELSTFSIVAYLLVNKEITVGTGIAAFGYVTSFLNPIRNILDCINCINSTKETVEETLSFLDSVPLISGGEYSANSVFNLELSDVTFETGQFSIKPFSFNFEKGKKYALVGHSGSGKSTLLRMIDGSIDLHSGIISIDGQDINTIERDAFVFSIDQFEYLFQTDFSNNITIFESMVDKRLLAVELLNTLNSITKNKIMSYETVDNLSGGEKQIINLLRMLVADRPIILLDESFSSIDKKNIALIREYLMKLEDQIIIEVTHDTSEENLSKYDTVISLNDGIAQYTNKHNQKTS